VLKFGKGDGQMDLKLAYLTPSIFVINRKEASLYTLKDGRVDKRGFP
jgi:hypothetical protein